MRPETVDDLQPHLRDGNEFLRVCMSHLPADGQTLCTTGHLIEHLQTLAAAGIVSVETTELRDFVVTTVPTEAELDMALKNAQSSWDHYQRKYQEAQETGVEPPNSYGLTQWCQAEGLPLPWAKYASFGGEA